MNLQRKIEIVKEAIRSISQHTDSDAAVRGKALDQVEELVKAERAAIDAQVADSIKKELGA